VIPNPDPLDHPARVLIVDDERDNRRLLEVMLASEGFELQTADSGAAALTMVATDPPDLILLDIMMPGMDGFETATRIKQDASIRDVPIIFLTAASGQPEQAFRGYAAGAVDYLAKPFDPGVLKAKVSVFVDLYLKASQLRDQAELLGGRPLTDQLSERLAAVEEALAALRALPAVSGDANTAETAARLAGRVGRLRDALDALGAGRG
jgi:CheY-like chemotaxis protein